MVIELYIFSLITIAYGIFTTFALIGINKLKRGLVLNNLSNLPFISIVISARNEAENIVVCLEQIKKQSYPANRYEVILVDDASDDFTLKCAEAFFLNSELNYQLVKRIIHQGKKKNISDAIDLARGTIIITSDADVVFRYANWLLNIGAYFVKHSPDMLVMPVDFKSDKKIINAFQIFENIALTAIAAGYAGLKKPFLCNGANLAFKKSTFSIVGGYQSHMHLSSGEDVFLMEEIKLQPEGRVDYLFSPEAIVKTVAQKTVSSLFIQRVRWASKTKYNYNKLNRFSALIVVLANLIFLALLVAIVKKSFIIPYLSIFAMAKIVFDFLLLFLASNFLGRVKYMWLIIPFECIYWCYALIVGISSFFIKPTWKGIKIN